MLQFVLMNLFTLKNSFSMKLKKIFSLAVILVFALIFSNNAFALDSDPAYCYKFNRSFIRANSRDISFFESSLFSLNMKYSGNTCIDYKIYDRDTHSINQTIKFVSIYEKIYNEKGCSKEFARSALPRIIKRANFVQSKMDSYPVSNSCLPPRTPKTPNPLSKG